ncbi:MAG: hypothetical protein MUW56_10545 [Chryseobacterium sp.]|uniref:hypothetical protein n=1 Tax=Chryseobacterium sp. TaxID=1871047 RepID=UPI0025C0072F|nr:hypothetical protein [Chryseobacterium sp.]MCJ7934051.1 hypothetical protein [Chryseobacterium sp.]
MEKGKRDGDAIFYHDNGKVNAKGEYKKDFKAKEWSYDDKNGTLTLRETFTNGKKHL